MIRDVVNMLDEIVGLASTEQIVAERLICRVAFIMLVNNSGELLLHQRAACKKSYPLYWSGAAAGHVRKGESYEAAAAREMSEELGVETGLEFIGKFFSAEEREMVAVFLGVYDGPVDIEPREVKRVEYFSVERLEREISVLRVTSFVEKALPLVLPRLSSLLDA